MCHQNTGNAVSETQNSKNVRGSMPTDPLQLCRHYGLPLNNILATLLIISMYIFLTLNLPHFKKSIC